LTAAEQHAPLPSRFLRSAALFPERPALEVAGSTLTYSELHRRAVAIARLLLDEDPGGATPQLTGVFASRSVHAFAAVLGVLLRGHGYVPLNPRFPVMRNRDMLERAGCRVVVVDPEHLDAARELTAELPEPPFLVVPPTEEPEGEVALPAGGPETPAYLLFTSGSTGRPKGVLVRQANVAACLDAGATGYDL
jgi:non-ribosomal peptide synthetase component F